MFTAICVLLAIWKTIRPWCTHAGLPVEAEIALGDSWCLLMNGLSISEKAGVSMDMVWCDLTADGQQENQLSRRAWQDKGICLILGAVPEECLFSGKCVLHLWSVAL
jgi:hypothetical protein